MPSRETLELVMADGSQIHQGDERRLRAVATNSADAATEPTQVKIKVTAPSGAAVTYAKTPTGAEVAMTQASDGNYYADHTFTEARWHSILAAGSGNMAEVEPKKVFVVPVSGAPSA